MITSQSIENIKTKSDAKIHEVKEFTNKIHKEKQMILSNSYKEVKSLSDDLENLKLQNEELERTIQDLFKERDNLENSYELLKKSYTNISQKYNETRDLLNISHNQNLQLSEAIEKIRQNEKNLISESQKLIRVGSTGKFNDLQFNSNFNMIENLEKEAKFWKQEAEKLKKVIDLQEVSPPNVVDRNIPNPKKSKKKIANNQKRYNKVIIKSHSIENSQRKAKENEYEKLKLEKEEMRNLLGNLENQICEIQNNVIKINNEKQQFKELFFDNKGKLDKSEMRNLELETQFNEKIKENGKVVSDNERHLENINILIKDNKRYQIANQNLSRELNDAKYTHCVEIKNLEMKIGNLMEENHDLGTRSTNLKDKVQSMEMEFSNLELDLRSRSLHIKEQSDFIENLKEQLDKTKIELKEKSDELNQNNEKIQKYQHEKKDLRKNEDILQSKLEIKTNETHTTKLKFKEKEEELNKLKISFTAQIVKFEEHLRNAEQIISSKIKLISTLELRLSNFEREMKAKDDEILHLKKQINSKNHEYEVLSHKYEENQDAKKYLQQHIDDISVDNNNNGREILALNQTISELSTLLEKLNNEIISQRRELEQKDEEIVSMNIAKTELEKRIICKDEEISKSKRTITQLRNDSERKEAHLESLLEVIGVKEDKIAKLQATIDKNEEKIKKYADQLDSCDDSIIQSSSRTISLEKEIEGLRNTNARLTKQKDQITLSLSARNKEVGQLQARLDNLESGRGKDMYLSYTDSSKADSIPY